jgi:hypothetical protein
VRRDTEHCGHRNSGAKCSGSGWALAPIFGIGGEIDEERTVLDEIMSLGVTGVEVVDEERFSDSRLESRLEILGLFEVEGLGEASEPRTTVMSLCSVQGSPL